MKMLSSFEMQHARANQPTLKHPQVREDIEASARLAPKSQRSKLSCANFCTLMDAAIAANPRPRTYLARSPSPRPLHVDSFAPIIDERSKQLASKIRPKVRRLMAGAPSGGLWRLVWSRNCFYCFATPDHG